MTGTVRAAALLVGAALLLAGCWDKTELTAWGYVMAASIDRSPDNGIRLTTQIYKPGSADVQNGKGAQGGSYLNLTSDSGTISQAADQIAGHLGRNLQWSHMRTLLIGEEFARSRNIGEVLDYFSRSQGQRGSINILIAAGKAYPILSVKPLIESTIGQQLKMVGAVSRTRLGQAVNLTLLDLDILAKSGKSINLIPRLEVSKDEEQIAVMTDSTSCGFRRAG